MRARKPYLRLVKYIFLASVMLLLTAGCIDEKDLDTAVEPSNGGTIFYAVEKDATTRWSGGRARSNPETNRVPQSIDIRLEAVPNKGFRFDRWEYSGFHRHVIPSDPSWLFVIISNISIKAFFIKLPPGAPHITGPAEGDTFLTTDSVDFSGSGTDSVGGAITGASLNWTSDLDGQIGTGESFSASLSAGIHSITLTATDSPAGAGIASISITVEAPPSLPPSASIANPLSGESYSTADNIPFNGSANDPEDGALTGASLVWTSDLDGQIGTGESFNTSLSAGNHTIALTATDSHGATGTDPSTITVEVPPGLPPTASIANPLIGESYSTADNIPFIGSANDPEDGALTGSSLVWTSDLDGQIGTGESFNTSLSGGSHTITLTVVGSQGALGTDSISITVNLPPADLPPANLPPTVSLAGNPDTGLLPLAVTWTATAEDTSPGRIVSYEWDFDGDGVADQNTLEHEVIHDYSGAGTFQARVTVLDDGGLSATATATVTVCSLDLSASDSRLPHAFAGTVTINGSPAPDGTRVTAIIGCQPVAEATVVDGRYSMVVGQPRGVFYAGKTITFAIDNSTAAQSATWNRGSIDLLNLTTSG